jgi:Na+-translocating ferredoxin:NAD+ oxidoreductase subunit B
VFEDACTGCGKCVDACPTECIELRPPTLTLTNWVWPVPEAAPMKLFGKL